MTHENSAVQQITNNNLVVIALDSLSVTKLKEMTSYLKGAYIYVGKQLSLMLVFYNIGISGFMGPSSLFQWISKKNLRIIINVLQMLN